MPRFHEPGIPSFKMQVAEAMHSNRKIRLDFMADGPIQGDVNAYVAYLIACLYLNDRPYCKVHSSMSKTIKSRSVSKVNLRDRPFPSECSKRSIPTICFKYQENSRFAVKWAILCNFQPAYSQHGCGSYKELRRRYWSTLYETSDHHIRFDKISEIPSDNIENCVLHHCSVYGASIDRDRIIPYRYRQELFEILQTYAAFRLGSDFIVDDVPLAVDVDKWERTKNKALIDKARRRGVIGWDLGKYVEAGPHMRRPHFGIRWKGTGHSRPELVPIRGCIVNGKKLKMPEGYEPVHD